MGHPKESLRFGPESMLQRAVRLVSQATGSVVIVASEGQQLPPLPGEVRVVRDRHPDRGPLEGLAAGLRELAATADRAFVTACDVPLLKPEFIRRMLELAEDFDVAVPHVGGFDEPLCAVYRRSVLPQIEALLAEDRRRPVFLFDRVRTRRVLADELTEVDPELQSLLNTNTPEAYQSALEKAGFGEGR